MLLQPFLEVALTGYRKFCTRKPVKKGKRFLVQLRLKIVYIFKELT